MWDWTAFSGGFFGSILGIILLILGFMAVDEWLKRKHPESASEPPTLPSIPIRNRPTEDLLEYHIEQYIVQHFQSLFPGWMLFSGTPVLQTSGVRVRTEAGEIDFLCLDEQQNLVIIELKRGKAPDTIVTQLDRYMAWVRTHIATEEQTVRGMILARSLDKRLHWILATRTDISVCLYQWHLMIAQEAINHSGDAIEHIQESERVQETV